ncbi:MAG: YbhB/YbcL family Raf kinase inhibitor-like protein [Polyangiales bacterium]
MGCAEEKATVLLADGGPVGAGAAKDASTGPNTGRVDGGIDGGRVDAGRNGDDDDDEPTDDDEEPTDDDDRKPDAGRDEFVLTSPSFVDGDLLPEENRCANALSPALSWAPGPEGTKSYAVQLRNPTGRIGQRSFWVLFDVPADVTEIPAGIANEERIEDPFPARQAPDSTRNGVFGYRGPCTETEVSLDLTVHALDVEELDVETVADEDLWIDQVTKQIAEHQIGEPARIEVKAISVDE